MGGPSLPHGKGAPPGPEPTRLPYLFRSAPGYLQGGEGVPNPPWGYVESLTPGPGDGSLGRDVSGPQVAHFESTRRGVDVMPSEKS